MFLFCNLFHHSRYNITGTEKESKKDKDMQQSSATIPKATASLEDLKSYWTRKEYALVEDKNKRLTPSEISGLLSLEVLAEDLLHLPP